MRHTKLLFIFVFIIFLVLGDDIFAVDIPSLKLPYVAGEKWAISQGYNGSFSHYNGLNIYAFDFNLAGENDFDKKILAAADGEIITTGWHKENDHKYGYGLYVEIKHTDNFVTRYAHLKSLNVKVGDKVKQGQEIGRSDSTGLSTGSHLHFSLYKNNNDGTKTPYKPEPMSGYTDFKAGQWYASDNELYDPNQKPPKPEPQTSPQTQPQPRPKTSLWSKILNFFSPLFTSEESLVKSEEAPGIKTASDAKIPPNPPLARGEMANNPPNPPLLRGEENNPTLPSPARGGEETYTLQFLNSNQTLTVKPGEVLNLKAEVKNTGTAVWKQQNISANVVGGSTINLQYYHSSWLTYLRPTLLQENEVAPGSTSAFSFTINTPEQTGNYVFQIQAVRTDAGFAPIPVGFWSVNLNLFESEPSPPEVKQARIEEKAKTITEKVIDKVEETAPEVFQTIKTFFGGGSGSSSSGQVQEEEEEEEPAEQPEEEVEEVEEVEEDEEDEEEEELAEEENDEEEVEEVVEIILPEIQITSPTTSPWFTQSSSTVITGIYNTSTFQIFVNNTSTPDLIMASSTWQYPVSLPISTSTFSFVGWNADLTVSSTALNLAIIREEEQIPDFTPPVITDFTVTINNTTALVSHEAVDEDSGVAEYVVQFLFPFNIDPRFDCDSSETDILSAADPALSDEDELFGVIMANQCTWFSATSTATTTVFEFPEDFFDLPLFFRLQTADQAGNITDWLYLARKYYLEGEDDGLPQEGKVLVSEIAWMGTGASPQDEWLEIINFDDQKIYLKDWRLVWGENIIYLDRVILSPYYSLLLERNSQQTVSDYDRSQVYYAGELDDAGEHLILYSGLGNIMDEVDASTGWFAGNNETKESMFRVDPPLNGNLPEAWVDFFASDSAIYGWYTVKHDADGNPIAGSPGDDEPVMML